MTDSFDSVRPAVTARIDAATRAVEELTLTPVTEESDLRNALKRIRRGADEGPIICELNAGLFGFLQAVFPDLPPSELYGQVFDREPSGHGAHFDVYDEYLHTDFPWVAIFNLAGHATVTTVRLPEALATSYARSHGEPSNEAYAERRRISEAALTVPAVHPDKGFLASGSGLIIPQQRKGPDWVHDVVPVLAQQPGRFVKFAAVEANKTRALSGRRYVSLDELLRKALNHLPLEEAENQEQQLRPSRHCDLD